MLTIEEKKKNARERQRLYRLRHPGIDSKRYYENHDKSKKLAKKRTAKWRDLNPEYSNQYYAKIKQDPIQYRKHLVRRNVQWALKTGKLIKKPCLVCNKKAQAHHEDYSKPLKVKWLCPTHHMAEHRI